MKDLENLSTLLKRGYIAPEAMSNRAYLFFFLRLFLLLLAFDVIFIALRIFADQAGFLALPDTGDSFDEYPAYLGFLLAAIAAPIIEELTFRMGLRFSKWNFVVMLAGLSLISIRVLMQLSLITGLLISLAISALSWIVLQNELLASLADLWRKRSLLIFYFLLLSFAAFHLSNYNFGDSFKPEYMLLVIPQLFSGVILSYARLKAGIISSSVLHIAGNSIVLLPSIFI